MADRFHLAPEHEQRASPAAISVFLHSAATSLGPRVVAAILSGDGRDGSSEMCCIKAHGGLTLAQSEADCPDMPMSAERTGFVDSVLRWPQIAAALRFIAALPARFARSEATGRASGAATFTSALMQEECLRGCYEIAVQTKSHLRRSAASLEVGRFVPVRSENRHGAEL
jgi:hypothetical protein